MLHFLLVFMIAAMSFAADPVLAGERSDMVKLQMLYDRFSQAVSDRDVNKMWSFMDPEVEFIDTNSKHKTLEKYKSDIDKTFKDTRNNNIVFDLKDIQVADQKASIYLDAIYRYEYYDKKAKDWVPVIITNTVDETWEKKSNVWKLVRSKQLRHQEAIDPQWIAEKQKRLDEAVRLHKLITTPCNSSLNGCL